jgi:uncharacterized caspase-like protein
MLSNPQNDAVDIANSLERLGFAVTRISDAAHDDMRRALLAFGRAARGTEMAVVFYSGHGIEIGGENWLIRRLASRASWPRSSRPLGWGW